MKDGLPPGTSLIGKPGPYDRRWAFGVDARGGPTIWGLDPLLSRDQKPPADEPAPS